MTPSYPVCTPLNPFVGFHRYGVSGRLVHWSVFYASDCSLDDTVSFLTYPSSLVTPNRRTPMGYASRSCRQGSFISKPSTSPTSISSPPNSVPPLRWIDHSKHIVLPLVSLVDLKLGIPLTTLCLTTCESQ